MLIVGVIETITTLAHGSLSRSRMYVCTFQSRRRSFGWFPGGSGRYLARPVVPATRIALFVAPLFRRVRADFPRLPAPHLRPRHPSVGDAAPLRRVALDRRVESFDVGIETSKQLPLPQSISASACSATDLFAHNPRVSRKRFGDRRICALCAVSRAHAVGSIHHPVRTTRDGARARLKPDAAALVGVRAPSLPSHNRGVVMRRIWGIPAAVGVTMAVVAAFLIIVLGGCGSLWALLIAACWSGCVRLDRQLCIAVGLDVDVPAVQSRS